MKARLEFMETVLMILATTFLIESIIFCFMFVSREKQERRAEEYKIKYEDIHDQHNALLLEKARLEEKNWKLETEVEELNKALLAALTAQPAAETQQEEPETLPQRSKITWTLDRLPAGKTNTFRCMDYRKITDKTSDQYILQSEDFTFSDTDTGLRFSIIDGEKYYHAALATAYGIDIGNTWHVTLDTGYELNIIHAEYKHAIDNPRADDFGDPDVNYAGDKTTSVIEFVYDWEAAPQEIIELGGMFIEDFGGKDGVLGNIVEMKPTGRKWEP